MYRDVIKNVAIKTGFYQAVVKTIADELFDEIKAQVADGERIKVDEFGAFEAIHKNERTGRNPRTGEAVKIPSADVPMFEPFKDFKERVANDG